MADNLSRTTVSGFALADHAVIALEGPEAVAFAHAQFANDVTGLPTGQWQWNAWLTPKGRVIALFLLARVADDQLKLVLPDYPADAFATALQRYVFRRKLKIAVADGSRAIGAFAPPAQARAARIGVSGEGLELDLGGDGGPRTLWLSSSAEASPDPARQQAWLDFDLRHGVPRLPASQREQWTPQQLSLDRLQAFSVKKGCYPGQEIVARTHFLGKAKRGLMLFAATGEIPEGVMVRSAENDVGEVVACSRHGDECLLLAVVPLEHDGEGLTANGLPLRRQPLAGGLQR
ncbi:YgfZ/GcvT domain-containing protein [Pseudoxanthomonas putridarboris]|uniref:CAF17-like 4Fe-4S cluster assembly/insertion protein YgfZ n=1 Tax=Pseudoxanthomonas putridarboris TaxID=752605 RepID=UPI003CE5279B